MNSEFDVQTTSLVVRQCEVDMAQRLDEKLHGDESMLAFLEALPSEPLERLFEDKASVLAFLHDLVIVRRTCVIDHTGIACDIIGIQICVDL